MKRGIIRRVVGKVKDRWEKEEEEDGKYEEEVEGGEREAGHSREKRGWGVGR